MKFFNIGALEFLFILLLALIVLGPRKAVKTAGEIGRWLKEFLSSPFWKDLQATSKEIQDLPKKIMDEAEIQKTIDELDFSEAARQRGIGQEKSEAVEEQRGEYHQIHSDPNEDDTVINPLK